MDGKYFKNITISVFIVVLTLSLIYSLFWGPLKKYGDSLYYSRTFMVSAEGKVTVKPDIAKLSFSVVSEGADTAVIFKENNERINSAIKFVKSSGVEDKDIQTAQYNLYPKYSYNKQTGRSDIYGYSLTQTVNIKIRNFEKISDILRGLPEIGINQMGSVQFSIDDNEKYLAEARDIAFKKAHDKAKEMAEKNGVRLGKIINFSEYQSTPYPNYYGASAGMGGGVDMIAKTIPSPTIEPGSEEVSIQVNVNYQIK